MFKPLSPVGVSPWLRGAVLLLLTACVGLEGLDLKDDDTLDATDTEVDTDVASTDVPTWETGDTAALLLPGDCSRGAILDCNGQCKPESFLGDDLCDDGTLSGRQGTDFACGRLRFDRGDCPAPGDVCGDGDLDPGEDCDDNNLVNGDGCSDDCTFETCGNNRVDPGETCDDGNIVDGDGCPGDCGVCLDDNDEDDDDLAGAVDSTGGGSFPARRVCPSDEDWRTVTLAIGQRLAASATFDHDEGDIDVQIRNPSGSVVASGTSSTDDELVAWTATVAGAHQVRTWLASDQGARRGNGYDLELTVSDCVVDAHEDDDTRGTAFQPASLPYTAGLHGCVGDDDYIAVDLAAGDVLAVDASFLAAEGNLDLYLLDASATVVAQADSTTDDESLRFVSSTPQRVWVRVTTLSDAGVLAGVPYDLSLSVLGCAVDAREDDDLPTGLTPIATPFLEAGLTACPLDPDHLAIDLTVGSKYTITGVFSTLEGTLGLRLLDPNGTAVLTANPINGQVQLSGTANRSGTFHAEFSLAADAGTVAGLPYEASVSVSSCPEDAAEQDDDQATAATPALPLVAAQRTACSFDEDWIAVPMTAGSRLNVVAEFLHADGDLDLQVRDASGSVIVQSTTSSDDESATWTSPIDQTVYVRLWLDRDFMATAGVPYALTLSVDPCVPDAFEPDDDPLNAPVPTASLSSRTACLGSPDHAAFLLDPGDVLDATATFDDNEADLTVRVLDASGATMATAPYSFGSRGLSYVAQAPGRYVVQVELTNDQGTAAGVPYQLDARADRCAQDTLEDDDDVPSANDVISPAQYTGQRACRYDADVFAVPVSPGVRVWAEALFDDSDGDIELELLAPGSGAVVASTSGFTDNETLAWYATSAGTAHLRVRLDDDSRTPPNVVGNDYSLRIVTDTCDPDAVEPNNNAAAAAALAPSGLSAALTLCDADEDWFFLAAPAGAWVSAYARYDRADGDLDLDIRNAVGGVEQRGLIRGDGTEVLFKPTGAGTWWVRTNLTQDLGADAGLAYQLDIALRTCAADVYESPTPNNDATAATPVAGLLSTTGLTLCPGDEDWYAVTLAPGGSVNVQTFFTDADGDLNLQVLDGNGTLVASSSSITNDESVAYTSASGGTFYVRAYMASLSSDGGVSPGVTYDIVVVTP